jgi:predicted aspartyl protease
MTGSAKNFAISTLFLCCAALAAAQPVTPDSAADSTLPARTVRGYLMVVGVTVDDRGPFDFLVDTGTNTTLLDPQLARELGLQAKDMLRLDSLSSSAGVPRYFLQKLKVGPAVISNAEALAVPLTQLNALDHRIRGILGMNFLLHFSFRLDFDRNVMELYPFPETANVPTGLRVPVQINESRLLIAVESSAAPRGAWKLALDSGISQFLVFQDRIAAANDHAASSRGGNRLMRVSTNLAQHAADTRVLRDLFISQARLPDQEVVVLRNDLQRPTDPQDGLLPAAPFHSVFFDRTTATVIFSPSPKAISLAALEAR